MGQGDHQSDTEGPGDQEQIIARHEAVHGPMPKRILAELRSRSRQAGVVGAEAVNTVGEATEALRLEVVETKLEGPRVLVGHTLGMRLLIPAEGIHGPREAASLLYLFHDSIVIRPTDDAPMSAIPLYGLHIVMPQVAIARWAYKAGRTAHANIDLEKDEREVEASLVDWTVDDFRKADDKLQVFMLAEIPGFVHLYQHLGLVRLAFEAPGGRLVRMKSALPESSTAYRRLWDLFVEAFSPAKLTMDPPTVEHEERPST